MERSSQHINHAQIRSHFLENGALIDKRYQILGLIGRGGQSSVFEACDLATEEVVAIKMLEPCSCTIPRCVERFEREVSLLATLSSPRTVRVYRRSTHQHTEQMGLPYMVMELLQGVSLSQHLNKQRFATLRDAVKMLVSILDCLSEAHTLGIVHRDVKPANIFLCAHGEVKLLDFGIALDVLEPPKAPLKPGVVLGTPGYMAPEVLMGREVGPAVDVYAFACVAFLILTGQRPFPSGKSVQLTAVAHLLYPTPRLSGELSGHPIETIINKAMARSPEERFPHADAVLHALRAIPDEALDVRLSNS